MFLPHPLNVDRDFLLPQSVLLGSRSGGFLGEDCDLLQHLLHEFGVVWLLVPAQRLGDGVDLHEYLQFGRDEGEEFLEEVAAFPAQELSLSGPLQLEPLNGQQLPLGEQMRNHVDYAFQVVLEGGL